jgi:phosphatidylserine decarboxylase
LKIARDGWTSVGAVVFMAIGAWFISRPVAFILLIPLAFILWFFRDPEREPDGDGWLSPADGTVVEIFETEHKYTGKATKIGIFMSGFNVHVNRFPVSAKIGYTEYVPGKKWFAIAPKASEINERFYVGAECANGRFLLVQIAGIMARRIAPRVKNGDTLDRGQRYGMIKLGSKVDIYLPPAVVPAVGIGDKVKAGQTVIGVDKNDQE